MGDAIWDNVDWAFDAPWLTRLLFRAACDRIGQPTAELANSIARRAGFAPSLLAPSAVEAWRRGDSPPPGDVLLATLALAGANVGSLVESLMGRPGKGWAINEESEMQRRRFLAGMAGFLGLASMGGIDPEPWERLAHALRHPKRVDAATINQLERVTVALEQLEPQVSPAVLRGPIEGHLSAIAELLQSEPRPAVRQPLLSLAAETAGLAGWLAWDVGDHDTAPKLFRTGLEAAREAGDAAIGAYLMGSASCQPAHTESPDRRLALLAEGISGFRAEDASPLTRSWLSTLEAEAHALAGAEGACKRALDRAYATAEATTGTIDEGARPRVPFFDRTYLVGEHGVSLARLGYAEDARALLELALSNLPERKVKTRPRLLVALGSAYAQDDALRSDIAEACRLGSEALKIANSQAVEPNVQDVRWLRRRLERWSGEPAIRELDEQLRESA